VIIRRCVVSIALLILLASLGAHAQTYIFGRADFAAGNAPSGVATGDFNGDGIPDLAVTNSYDNTISVLLGRPNATFAPQVTYATGTLPISVVAGDFNGDGNLDLAIANGNCTPSHESEPPQCSPSTISILLGNGDGTFQAQVPYSVGTLPASIVAADFNGDGKLDLAVLNDEAIGILLGNGDGTFQAQVTYAVTVSESIGLFTLPTLVPGDFNGDGNLDLAVAGSNSISVLLSNGNGTFQPTLETVCTECDQSMATGDFNGDGILDLALTGENTRILLGLGNGTFYLNATYQSGSGTAIAVADLNGDGKLDLVITQAGRYLTVLGGSFAVQLGNGNGTFGDPVFYGTGSLADALLIDDFNGDGKLDVAVADVVCGPLCSGQPSFTGSVSVVLGLGDGTFVSSATYSADELNFSNGSMLSADFLNNGNLDIAVIDAPLTAVDLFLGNGNGTFQPFTSFSTPSSPFAIATGDLRNNGDLDLVSANNPCTSTCTPAQYRCFWAMETGHSKPMWTTLPGSHLPALHWDRFETMVRSTSPYPMLNRTPFRFF
jgi:hypothetical protein